MKLTRQNGVNYIALDTNIFIHHLRLVQSLHDVLSSMSPVSHNILVPSVVINGEQIAP
jgi:hypothetical protein